jgi:hypothetical protein
MTSEGAGVPDPVHTSARLRRLRKEAAALSNVLELR